ncbi:MAG: Rieske 2Fe-2S domain-containing protein [Planctomycetaceae bacterium]|nr:Rieske 2Fe-2S domain-containing protein [Planctomycetaceae bacterium]
MTNSEDVSQPTDLEYHTAAKVGDIPEGQGKTITIAGHTIGLFFTDGNYFAISDFCPHQGASLSGGHVEDGQVMCPWHAWKFKLKDGTWADSPSSPIRCDSYPVRIVEEEIQIGIPNKQAS